MDKGLLIAKTDAPNLLDAAHIFRLLKRHIFGHQREWMIRQLRFPQSGQPHILFPVDESKRRGQLFGKKIIDHRKDTVVGGIGLLHVGAKGVVIEGGAIGKGDDVAIHPDQATIKLQLLIMLESHSDSLLFCCQVIRRCAMLAPPLVFQTETFVKILSLQHLVLIRIGLGKLVDVVALRGQFLPAQCGKGLPFIEIVVKIAVPVHDKSVRALRLQQSALLFAEVGQQQQMVFPGSLLGQQRDNFRV